MKLGNWQIYLLLLVGRFPSREDKESHVQPSDSCQDVRTVGSKAESRFGGARQKNELLLSDCRHQR